MSRLVAAAALAALVACRPPAARDPSGGPAPELVEVDVAGLAAKMSDGTWTSRQITAGYLARIAALDDAGPRLAAVIEVNPRALEEAAALDRARATALVDGVKAAALLRGWRGAPPADRAALVDALLRVAQMAVDHPQISELDINPLLVLPVGQGVVALDARVLLA